MKRLVAGFFSVLALCFLSSCATAQKVPYTALGVMVGGLAGGPVGAAVGGISGLALATDELNTHCKQDPHDTLLCVDGKPKNF